jgi:DNA polymerase III subunit beta
MKLQILQDNFARAISIASRFTSVKAQLPVLGNILLKTDKNKLLVGATNLESSILIKIGAKIIKEGSITVPSNILSNLIGNIKSETLNLEVNNENLSLTANNFKSNINSMNANDFPVIPEKISKSFVNLETLALSGAIHRIVFSASNDEVRPVLTGVLMIFSSNSLKMVATDGFRLSMDEFEIKGVKSETKFIIPKNILSEIVKLAGNNNELELSYNEDDNQVLFSVDNIIFASRIIGGEFPDFEKIIPKSHKISISVDKEDLLSAVKLASVFAKDASNMMIIDVGKDSLEISAESSRSGSQKTTVDALVKSELSSKKAFKIAFNYRFLEEFLGSVSGEEVKIEMTDPDEAAVFTDPKDKKYLHLIMPVKLGS